jgi:hypothetical protein
LIGRVWDAAGWKLLGFLGATWIVGVVVPAVTQYSSDRTRAAETRASVIGTVTTSMFPVVESLQSGIHLPSTYTRLGFQLQSAEVKSEAAIYAAVPDDAVESATDSLEAWTDPLEADITLGSDFARCRRYARLTPSVRKVLLTSTREDFDFAAAQGAYGLFDKPPMWQDSFCTKEGIGQDAYMEVVDAQPSYLSVFVQPALRMPIRGSPYSTSDLLTKLFLPWKD